MNRVANGTLAMTERPILFSGPMVRAILDGRKTQTRRVMNTRGVPADEFWAKQEQRKRPAYEVGDHLWVRETWRLSGQYALYQPRELTTWAERTGATIAYRADADDGVAPWRPSIHMPRWASRSTLEVTDVRVERLQDIGEIDARAEGIWYQCGSKEITRGYLSCDESVLYDTALQAFAGLWDSLNAKRGYGWDTNPWVWVIEFKSPTKGEG